MFHHMTGRVTSGKMSLALIICILFQTVFANAGQSPALIWSPTRSLSDLPQSYIGSSIDNTKFVKDYLIPLTKGKGNNIVIFQQDKLRLEDFTNHADVYNAYSDGGAFRNIKNLMDKHFSVHIPNVKGPEEGIASMISKFQGVVHKLEKPFDVGTLKLSGNKKNLIIVNLPTHSGEVSKGEALLRNDKHVGQILQDLTEKGLDYIAVYTGKHATKRSTFSSNVSATRRKLLATDDTANATFFNVSGGMFFYASKISFTIVQEETDKTLKHFAATLPPITDPAESFVANRSGLLNLKYKLSDSEMKMDINLKMEFAMRKKPYDTDWAIGNISISYNGTWNKTSFDEKDENDMIVVSEYGSVGSPATFSYHCPKVGPLKLKNETDKKNRPQFHFTHFQLQPFNIKDGKFSAAWDCVPFFTGGIWMALFCSALLLILVAWGMAMISSLTTMDRFDDPKGKTITVTVNE